MNKNQLEDHLFFKEIYKDNRGYFLEEFNITKNDLNFEIKQISESFSKKNTFRGFHFEIKNKMNKIICVKKGSAQFFCLNLNSKKVNIYNLKQISKNDSNISYLFVPWNCAVAFITSAPTVVRYFHDSTRSNNNRTINYKSIEETKSLTNRIKHISKNDLNSMLWDSWINSEECKINL